MAADEERIRGIICSDAWLMRVLETVGRAGLPDAWVGAGVLRDLVWGQLYGPGFAPGESRDVDVAFFDAGDLSRHRDEQAHTIQPAKASPVTPQSAASARTMSRPCGRLSTRAGWCHGPPASRGGNGACVEVADAGSVIAVRDSKDPTGPVLAFVPAEWGAFTAAVKDGEFDLS